MGFSNWVELHVLHEPGWIWEIAWNLDGTRLATADHGFKRPSSGQSTTKADYSTAHIWNTAHLVDPKFHAELGQLKAGTFSPEQLMLIHLFNQFGKRNQAETQASLKDVAHHAQTPGITTAELARVLLSFCPVIMNGILARYHVSAKKNGEKQQDHSYKALQEIMQYITTRNETSKEAHGQGNQNTPARPEDLPIATALEGYLDTSENYLDAYKTYQEIEKYIDANQKDLDIALIKNLLAEYIIEEHPAIEKSKISK